MAFDLGAAMNAGLRSYGQVRGYMDDAEERRKREEAEQISKDTVGKVGTEVVDKSQANMGAANPDEYSPKTKIYSEAEAYRDQATKLAGAGQFDRAAKSRATGLAIEKGDLDVKAAKRADEEGERKAGVQKKVDAIMAQSAEMLQNPQKAIDFMMDKYNNPEKGSPYDDGHTAQMVSTASGPQAVFQDKSGKVVNVMPVNAQSAWQAVRDYQVRQLATLSPEYAEAADRHFDRLLENQLKLRKDTRETNQDSREQQLLPGRIDLQSAQASSARASAAVNSQQATALKRQNDAITSVQPMLDEYKALSPEQQSSPEGRAILRKAQVHLASKSGDIAKMFDLDAKQSKNIEIKSNPDGTGFTIFHKGADGAVPLGVVGENGALLPAGMDSKTFQGISAKAKKAGVDTVVGIVDGKATVGFVGKDGETYPTLEEAAKAYGGTPVAGLAAEPNIRHREPQGQTGGYAPWFAATQPVERQREEELRRRQQARLSGYLPR